MTKAPLIPHVVKALKENKGWMYLTEVGEIVRKSRPDVCNNRVQQVLVAMCNQEKADFRIVGLKQYRIRT